jgi:hypothetical protein
MLMAGFALFTGACVERYAGGVCLKECNVQVQAHDRSGVVACFVPKRNRHRHKPHQPSALE